MDSSSFLVLVIVTPFGVVALILCFVFWLACGRPSLDFTWCRECWRSSAAEARKEIIVSGANLGRAAPSSSSSSGLKPSVPCSVAASSRSSSRLSSPPPLPPPWGDRQPLLGQFVTHPTGPAYPFYGTSDEAQTLQGTAVSVFPVDPIRVPGAAEATIVGVLVRGHAAAPQAQRQSQAP